MSTEPVCQFSDRLSTALSISQTTPRSGSVGLALAHSHDGEMHLHSHGGGGGHDGTWTPDEHGHTHEHLEHAGGSFLLVYRM